MPYTITLDPARQDLDAIHKVLAGTYWSSDIRREVVAEAFRNSIVVLAIDDASGETVGFARVVTDRATFAWLCDVFVLEGHRGHGLSRRMLEELERHPSLQTLRRWCLATRDAHGLYEKFGYRPVPADRWMEKQGAKERWQESRAPDARTGS
jgi:GNAT superfamily N-acetyltransferase